MVINKDLFWTSGLWLRTYGKGTNNFMVNLLLCLKADNCTYKLNTRIFLKGSLLSFEFYNGPQGGFITRTRLQMEVKPQNSPV